MDQNDLCLGMFIGFVVAGIAGYVFQRIRLASVRAREATTRQRVVGQTDRTPMEAVRRHFLARLEILFLAVFLIAFLAAVAWLIFR